MTGRNDPAKVDAVAKALGRIPSGLFVVTARRGEEETSFLASWVMQAGFAPPAVTVGVGQTRPARAFMEPAGARFAISVIGADERRKLGPFFKPVGADPGALDALAVDRTPGGLAVVRGCLAWLECVTLRAMLSGDHVIVLGEVTRAVQARSGDPTVHVRPNGLDY
jgi:flavin reductase (DIM6/NTAB) family NADH-FMN oxidoreductase RutF